MLETLNDTRWESRVNALLLFLTKCSSLHDALMNIDKNSELAIHFDSLKKLREIKLFTKQIGKFELWCDTIICKLLI